MKKTVKITLIGLFFATIGSAMRIIVSGSNSKGINIISWIFLILGFVIPLLALIIEIRKSRKMP